MNTLAREKQIEIIAALCDGVGVRATARLTGVNRETVGTLALRIGQAYAELHDRMYVGIVLAASSLTNCGAMSGVSAVSGTGQYQDLGGCIRFRHVRGTGILRTES